MRALNIARSFDTRSDSVVARRASGTMRAPPSQVTLLGSDERPARAQAQSAVLGERAEITVAGIAARQSRNALLKQIIRGVRHIDLLHLARTL